MRVKDKIPESFYKLFRTKNRDAYMNCLVSVYQENNKIMDSFGMTEDEARCVIEETLTNLSVLWQMDEWEDAERIVENQWQEESLPEMFISAGTILRRFIRWGWLLVNYDEKMNENMVSFPEYSQLYIELFERLQQENGEKERQSIVSVYSDIFTYVHAPKKEKNIHILENALQSSRNLSQMLSNMQEGMREYFEELAGQTDFLGVQEVLVREISNGDSQKYAILTTTDSFYRYKESIKELLSEILEEEYAASDQLVYRIEREFDGIEKKYNHLIRQKTIFAKRALARIKYMMQESTGEKDSIKRFVQWLGRSNCQDAYVEAFRENLRLSVPMKLFTADSLQQPKREQKAEYMPVVFQEQLPASVEDFVPKPLYTGRQLEQFRRSNTKNGIFVANEDTVQKLEDLEKLMLVWQEATQDREGKESVSLGKEIIGKEGFTYTELTIQ